MSHQGESLLQEFQHFLERLQYGINKGLDNNLVTIDIKKAMEVHLNVKDVKKEVKLHLKLKIK
jgi:hypothetical protein